MSEVVWVFGNSAAGKETFILRMLANENDPVRETLGWAGSVVTAAASSINYIGQFDGDPITANRDKIMTEVPGLLASADVALIKWQGVDCGAQRPEQLQLRLPEASHSIIHLITPYEILKARLELKSWWKDECDIDDLIKDEEQTVESYIDSLSNIMPVTKINSTLALPYQNA